MVDAATTIQREVLPMNSEDRKNRETASSTMEVSIDDIPIPVGTPIVNENISPKTTREHVQMSTPTSPQSVARTRQGKDHFGLYASWVI